jgi:hypothetical protein
MYVCMHACMHVLLCTHILTSCNRLVKSSFRAYCSSRDARSCWLTAASCLLSFFSSSSSSASDLHVCANMLHVCVYVCARAHVCSCEMGEAADSRRQADVFLFSRLQDPLNAICVLCVCVFVGIHVLQVDIMCCDSQNKYWPQNGRQEDIQYTTLILRKG